MVDPFDILFTSPIFQQVTSIFLNYWWLAAPFILAPIFWSLWLRFVQIQAEQRNRWVLLEIIPPKEIPKTPAAMEQVLAGFHGIYAPPNIVEKYIKGEKMPRMSLEIVGIDGEVHFFIRAPQQYQMLTQSHIYSQYPQAEIHEVEDYVNRVPPDIPNESWDLWGTEFLLTKEDAYPIRTYVEFGLHKEQVEEETKVDPLAGITEVLANLKKGEEIWIQIIISPAEFGWEKAGEELIEKIAGRAKEPKPGLLGRFFSSLGNFFNLLLGKEKEKQPSEEIGLVIPKRLTPAEAKAIQDIERNISKPGFETTIRVLYLGKKGVFQKARGRNSLFGAFRQFNSQTLNSFIPDFQTITQLDFFYTKWRLNWRKKKLFFDYKRRWLKSKRFIFNVEELATLFHFPGRVITAPLMPRVRARKAEPPATLPIT